MKPLTNICCLQEIYFKYKDQINEKIKGWENIYQLTLFKRKLD